MNRPQKSQSITINLNQSQSISINLNQSQQSRNMLKQINALQFLKITSFQ